MNMVIIKVSKNVIYAMTSSPSQLDCANSMFAHTHMLCATTYKQRAFE